MTLGRVLVASGGSAGAHLAEAVLRRGGEPVRGPLIATAPPSDPGALAAAVDDWNERRYDWLAVTSANGAAATAAARPDAGRFAAVGPATAAELQHRGIATVLTPADDFTAAGLADAMLAAFGAERKQRVLLPLSESAGTVLETTLREAGHEVTRVGAYRTVPTADDPALAAAIAAGAIDAILVTSGSIAREVARRFAPLPPGVVLAAIGDPAARALSDCGLAAQIIAERHTADGLIDALKGHSR